MWAVVWAQGALEVLLALLCLLGLLGWLCQAVAGGARWPDGTCAPWASSPPPSMLQEVALLPRPFVPGDLPGEGKPSLGLGPLPGHRGSSRVLTTLLPVRASV